MGAAGEDGRPAFGQVGKAPQATSDSAGQGGDARPERDFPVETLAALTRLSADWFWECDAELRPTFISEGFRAATGIDPRSFIGRAPLDRAVFDEEQTAALEARKPFRDLLLALPDGGGRRRRISIGGVPRFDAQGNFSGYHGFGRALTGRASSGAEAGGRPAHASGVDGVGDFSRLPSVLDVTREAFAYYDSKDRLVVCNRAKVEIYQGLEDVIRPGVTYRTILETGAERGILVIEGESVAEWCDRLVAHRHANEEAENIFVFTDGRYVRHQEKRTEDGGTVTICTDITAFKQHEAELEAARREAELAVSDLERTIDSMQMGVIVVEQDLSVSIVNRAYRALWRYEDDIAGRSVREMLEAARAKGFYDIGDEEWESYAEGRIAEIRAGDILPREVTRPDGRTMIFSITALSRGRRLLTYYDVTPLKQREAEIAGALERSKLAQAVLDGLPSPIFVKDTNLDFVLVNKAFAALFETEPQTMIGKKGADFVAPEDARFFEESERQVLETGEDYQVEEDFKFAGIGRSRLVSKNRVETESGRAYVSCTIFDISDLKRRERDAHEARAHLAMVLETLPAGVIIYDKDDRFVLANRKIHDALPALEPAMRPGKPLREALELAHDAGYFRDSGEPELDRLYDSDRDAWIETYARRYRLRQYVHERRNPDGRWFKVLDTRREDGTFVGVRVDITELKTREQELKESMRENEVFRNLIDNVPVAIYAKRPDLRLMYVNKGWSDLLGVAAEVAVGKTDVEIFGEQGERFMESDLVVLRTGQRKEIEEVMEGPDGEMRYQIARKDALVASDGSLYLIGSTMDVTELKRREQELRVAQEKAVAADRAKSEFLANMSHEIRTPMNGVLGMAELLSKTELSSKQKTFTDIIVKSGTALLTIINDILDFSKIDAGQLVLDPAPFNLAEAVEDVATLVSSRAKEKELEMIVRIDPSLPEMFVGDVGRFRQIVTNLLGNAVKFTDHGHVLVDVDGESENGETRLTVSVSDTGMGIPKEKLALVFDKFSQVDASSTRRHEGTGLGLAITSRLVALMGGEMDVESEEGEGSTFRFTLTLPRAEGGAVARLAPHDVTGARVLVVDDNATNRTILIEQMAHWGFDACAAESGEEGLTVLKATADLGLKVDCAVVDHQMPGMSGLETVRAIRASDTFGDMPVIMLSSVDQSLSSAGPHDVHVDAQLIKPARAASLLEALVHAIQRHRGLVEGEPVTEQTVPQHSGRFGVQRRTAREEKGAPAGAPAGGVEVLVAEDNEVNQLVFSQILSESGLSFSIVNNGREAVDAFETLNPGLVLMDVSMPQMNGLEAAQAIRAMEAEHEKEGRVPIIGVTAHALKGDRERCLEAGMDDYLSKPISPRTLLEKIERWSGGASGERPAWA